MKKKCLFSFVFILLLGISNQAQNKKWTLEECVNYAVAHNLSVQQSILNTEVAAIDKKSAIGNFLPSVNANSSHSWNIGLNQNIVTNLLENQTTQFTSAGLNSDITIYNGLQNQNKLRRANLSFIASQYQLTKMKEDIALNVANAFLQILFNKENVKVQIELLKNNEKQLQRTTELVNSGAVARGDLLDVKATVSSEKQKIIVTENALLISKLSLAQLLQLENFQNFDISDSNYEPKNSPALLETPASIFEKAKQERVELKLAKMNLDIAARDLKIAKGAYQPNLIGFYNFSTRAGYSQRIVGGVPSSTIIGVVEGTNSNVISPNFTPIFGNAMPVFDQFSQNKGHSFGVQLRIPVLNGFTVRNNVARSKVNFEKSQLSLSQAALDLERNVFTAFTDANGALKSYESAVVALDARQEAYNYAREKLAVGMMNAFDFNQAQTLYTNAQSEVLRTKYDYIFRIKVLEFYFGIPIIQN